MQNNTNSNGKSSLKNAKQLNLSMEWYGEKTVLYLKIISQVIERMNNILSSGLFFYSVSVCWMNVMPWALWWLRIVDLFPAELVGSSLLYP